jgi:NADH/NAD ratio-sensing transcriptional regulator Rex
MKEFLEYIKSCGKIITSAELSELVDKRSKRVDLNYLGKLIKDMGYNVIAVCEGCIYF